MFKRFIVLLLTFIGLSAFAADNFLNSVVIDNSDGEVSVILRSDSAAKIKKEVESFDRIVISVKGVAQSPDINTLYKNVSNVRSLVIQNDGNLGLKIYIDAPGISKANIVMETPNSSPIVFNTGFHVERVAWSAISVMLMFIAMISAKNMAKKENKKDINEIIKEREMALYRNFQKEVASLPNNNYKLKSYRKYVLDGGTIRDYEKKLTRV